MIEYLWLFAMGMLLMVGTIERTINAHEGRWFAATLSTVIVSFTTWYSINSASSCLHFGAFSAGTVVATLLTARRHIPTETKEFTQQIRRGAVLYKLGTPGGRKTACPCPACSGTGHTILGFTCVTCAGHGGIMFEYRMS